MSTTTSNLGLVKPDQGEQYNVDIVNANNDIIDTAVGSLQGKTTPGAITDLKPSIVDAAGFATQSANAVKMGNVVQLDLQVRRTGSSIGTGDIVNVNVLTLPAGWRPLIATGAVMSAFGSASSLAVSGSGVVVLASTVYGWATGTDFSFSLMFLVP